MSKESLIRQLLAARAQIDATLHVLFEEVEAEDEQEEAGCTHSEVINLTVMGGPVEWICKQCSFHHIELQ